MTGLNVNLPERTKVEGRTRSVGIHGVLIMFAVLITIQVILPGGGGRNEAASTDCLNFESTRCRMYSSFSLSVFRMCFILYERVI